VRLDEFDNGVFGAKGMELGRSKRRTVERAMRNYVMVDVEEPKLFFQEKNVEVASSILEDDVESVLTGLHDRHRHFAAGITLGIPHGKVYWPWRAYHIRRWVSSYEPCLWAIRIQNA